jgi:hypothetical protein
MALTDKDGNWIDGSGRSIHRDLVPILERKQDEVVEKVFRRLMKLEERIIKDRETIKTWLEKYFEYEDKATGTPRPTGNLTLKNYSDTLKIKFRQNDVIEFDDRIQRAAGIIRDLLEKWSGDARPQLKALVNEAFNSGQKGKIDRNAIFRLRKLKIDDPEWKQAMDLIDQSVSVAATRRYIQLLARNGGSDYCPLDLNLNRY